MKANQNREWSVYNSSAEIWDCAVEGDFPFVLEAGISAMKWPWVSKLDNQSSLSRTVCGTMTKANCSGGGRKTARDGCREPSLCRDLSRQPQAVRQKKLSA